MADHEAEQLGEQPGRSERAETVAVATDERADLTLEEPVVELGRAVEQRDQCVGRRDGVAAVDRGEQPGEAIARRTVQPSDGSEVEQRERVVGPEHHVAAVQVGVEDAGPEDLAQHGREQLAGDLGPPLAGHPGELFAGAGHGLALHALHHQDPGPGEPLVDQRDVHRTGRGLRGGDGAHVGGLDPVVELLVEARREAVREGGEPDGTAPVGALLEHARQPAHDVEVRGDLGTGVPALHLHDDRRAVREPTGVHLAHRRRSDRLGVELGQHLGEGLGRAPPRASARRRPRAPARLPSAAGPSPGRRARRSGQGGWRASGRA